MAGHTGPRSRSQALGDVAAIGTRDQIRCGYGPHGPVPDRPPVQGDAGGGPRNSTVVNPATDRLAHPHGDPEFRLASRPLHPPSGSSVTGPTPPGWRWDLPTGGHVRWGSAPPVRMWSVPDLGRAGALPPGGVWGRSESLSRVPGRPARTEGGESCRPADRNPQALLEIEA